jgi:HEAT repeat protein
MNSRLITILSGILAVVLLITVLAGLSWKAMRSREPAYQGKTLSTWLRQFEDAKANQFRDRAQFEAQFVGPTQNAVRQMGTNALPTLLTMLQAKDSEIRSIAIHWLDKRSFRWLPASQTVRREMALDGFAALGTNAEPAVPALMALLNHTNCEFRTSAARCLISIWPVAQEAVPVLVQHLRDPDEMVCFFSGQALGAIRKSPELVVPALTERLKGPGMKWGTLLALGRFGPEAKTAVPLIIPLLNDPDAETRSWAAMSLKAIDSEAAARAGVK